MEHILRIRDDRPAASALGGLTLVCARVSNSYSTRRSMCHEWPWRCCQSYLHLTTRHHPLYQLVIHTPPFSLNTSGMGIEEFVPAILVIAVIYFTIKWLTGPSMSSVQDELIRQVTRRVPMDQFLVLPLLWYVVLLLHQ